MPSVYTLGIFFLFGIMHFMHTKRTRFKKDIVCEFLPPQRKTKKQKVIIFCPGMPSSSSKGAVLDFWSKKGFWVFLPRYRGSWESSGSFLKVSPDKDILDVAEGLKKGFSDVYNGQKYKIENPEIYLFASSFGGAAALLCSGSEIIKKVIALSPVVDWTKESKKEPIDWLALFVKEAFGEAYRFSKKDWRKLQTGKFYNPVYEIGKIKKDKVFIIHAKDDDVVLFGPVKNFTKKLGCKSLFLKKGGHLSFSCFLKPSFVKRIDKFLKEK